MTKNDIKDYMIVETGFNEEKLIVLAGSIVDDELNGFSLDEYDENLINISNKPYSISKVYEPVKLKLPYELNIEEIFKRHNPKELWERQPTPVSLKYLKSLKKSKLEVYVRNLVYPCVTVE